MSVHNVRRIVISAFDKAELLHQAKVWEKTGYKIVGEITTERILFQENDKRVSRLVYLQVLIHERSVPSIDNISTNE